jgi:hypothetical protein
MMRQYAGQENLGADPKATMAVIDAHYKTLNSTITVLTVMKKLWPDVKLFAEESKARSKKAIAIRNTQIPSATAEAKAVGWDDVLLWRDAHWNDLTQQEQLLLGLYTMRPPARLDYTPMKIVPKKPRVLEPLTNYLVLGKTPYFLFHAYKTHHIYGDMKHTIPVDLKRVLTAWIASHPGQTYLLEDKVGLPWSDNRLGKAVQAIFKNYHGLATGVTALRHSYLTDHYYNMPSIIHLQKVARDMMHSPHVSQQYRTITHS